MIAQGLYNKPLAGAVYGVYRADTDELVTEMTTAGVMGKATSEVFTYCGNGEFYIQEITPPKYYAPDTNKYPFTMTKDHEVLVREVKNDTLIGKLVVWYKEVPTESTAPKTGDTTDLTLWLIAGGVSLAALVALGVGFSVRKKKTTDTEENNEA
ncbi:MAG: prealbumin-like fold domain-containing protein, partial [Oscillospiraceae bacterium]|nr:prealbumin-like fold domain-containing protein [Oscillospiraceae bacterium]